MKKHASKIFLFPSENISLETSFALDIQMVLKLSFTKSKEKATYLKKIKKILVLLSKHTSINMFVTVRVTIRDLIDEPDQSALYNACREIWINIYFRCWLLCECSYELKIPFYQILGAKGKQTTGDFWVIDANVLKLTWNPFSHPHFRTENQVIFHSYTFYSFSLIYKFP